MTEWKPDLDFLDFLVEEWGQENDPNKAFLAIPNGTKKGGEGYNIREVAELMRQGTERYWQRIYTRLHDDCMNDDNRKSEFEAYKARK